MLEIVDQCWFLTLIVTQWSGWISPRFPCRLPTNYKGRLDNQKGTPQPPTIEFAHHHVLLFVPEPRLTAPNSILHTPAPIPDHRSHGFSFSFGLKSNVALFLEVPKRQRENTPKCSTHSMPFRATIESTSPVKCKQNHRLTYRYENEQ